MKTLELTSHPSSLLLYMTEYVTCTILCLRAKLLQSCPFLFVTLWTVTCQTPHPWNFLSKNTGVGSHSLLQGIFLDPGIKPWSPALAGGFSTTNTIWEAEVSLVPHTESHGK